MVLDAGEDRFAASVRALRYGFAADDRKDLVVEGKRYASIDVPYRREESVDLVAQESVDGLVDADPDVERDVDLVEDSPLRAGWEPGSARSSQRSMGRRSGRPSLSRRRVTRGPRSGSECGIPLGGFSNRR